MFRTCLKYIPSLLLALMTLTVWTGAAHSQRRSIALVDPPFPSIQNRWCLLVGIDRYDQGAGLHCACSDAHRIYQALTQTGGCLRSHAVLMTTEDQTADDLKPTRQNILRAWGDLERHAGPDGEIILYYAGHGKSVGNESFLVPSDAIKPGSKISLDSLISVKWLRDQARQKCPRGSRLLLLDSCNSGGTRSLALPAPPALDGAQKSRTVTIAACGADEVSYEFSDLPAGAFTYLLERALRGAADYGHTGTVTSREAFRYVRSRITPLLEQHGDGDALQTPLIIPSDAVNVALTHPGRTAPLQPEDAPLLARRTPLAPVVFLTTDLAQHQADGTQRTDDLSASVLWQNLLLRDGFLLTDEDTQIQDYSLTIRGESHSSTQVPGIFTVSVLPLTAVLRDAQGRILASEQVDGGQFTTRAGTQEGEAYQNALEAASDALFTKLDPRLKTLVSGK